jgi:cytochrome b
MSAGTSIDAQALEVQAVADATALPTDAPPPSAHATATKRVRVWDLPLRIFHWSLLAAVTVAIVTGEIGGEWMVWHGRAGLAIAGLLVFRIVWGLVGSTTSRFAHFAPTPRKIADHLRGRWRGIGHNPLGALSVIALLGVLGVQVTTGLFTNDDISFTGPLYALVDDELALRLTGWHRQLSWALFALLALHVAAIAWYLVRKKRNLVKPMVTGWSEREEAADADLPPKARGGPLAFVVALAAALAAVYIVDQVLPAKAAAPAPAVQSTPGW